MNTDTRGWDESVYICTRQWRYPEDRVARIRTLYLVIIATILLALAGAGVYAWRHVRAAAECETPAPPPKPATPPPNLPDFDVAPACGPGEGK